MTRHCSRCGGTDHIRGSRCPRVTTSVSSTALASSFNHSTNWINSLEAGSPIPLRVLQVAALMVEEITNSTLSTEQKNMLFFSIHSPTGADAARRRTADFRRNPYVPRILRLSGVPRLTNFENYSPTQLKIAVQLAQRAFTRERLTRLIRLPTGVPMGRGAVDYVAACREDHPINWTLTQSIQFVEASRSDSTVPDAEPTPQVDALQVRIADLEAHIRSLVSRSCLPSTMNSPDELEFVDPRPPTVLAVRPSDPRAPPFATTHSTQQTMSSGAGLLVVSAGRPAASTSSSPVVPVRQQARRQTTRSADAVALSPLSPAVPFYHSDDDDNDSDDDDDRYDDDHDDSHSDDDHDDHAAAEEPARQRSKPTRRLTTVLSPQPAGAELESGLPPAPVTVVRARRQVRQQTTRPNETAKPSDAVLPVVSAGRPAASTSSPPSPASVVPARRQTTRSADAEPAVPLDDDDDDDDDNDNHATAEEPARQRSKPTRRSTTLLSSQPADAELGSCLPPAAQQRAQSTRRSTPKRSKDQTIQPQLSPTATTKRRRTA